MINWDAWLRVMDLVFGLLVLVVIWSLDNVFIQLKMTGYTGRIIEDMFSLS